jgi:uncharacterized protein
MLFMVMCKDKPGKLEARMEKLDDHRNYVDNQPLKVVLSGPLVQGNGDMHGSLYVLEADELSQAQHFADNDPLAAADVWESVTVSAFTKRVGWND